MLHGPPGTGKTLTAEGIAELLKRPLYMVSTGELGTRSDQLEIELNKILDVAHSWGAVLLLDEADVFLGMAQRLNRKETSTNTYVQRLANPKTLAEMPLSASSFDFLNTSKVYSS